MRSLPQSSPKVEKTSSARAECGQERRTRRIRHLIVLGGGALVAALALLPGIRALTAGRGARGGGSIATTAIAGLVTHNDLTRNHKTGPLT